MCIAGRVLALCRVEVHVDWAEFLRIGAQIPLDYRLPRCCPWHFDYPRRRVDIVCIRQLPVATFRVANVL